MDEEVRQKEMRSITIDVRYRSRKDCGGDNELKVIKVKVDTEEFTFDTLHKHIRKQLSIDDKTLPLTRTIFRNII